MGEGMPRNRVEAFEASHSKELEPELDPDTRELFKALAKVKTAARMGELLVGPGAIMKAVGRVFALEVDMHLAAQVIDAIVIDPRHQCMPGLGQHAGCSGQPELEDALDQLDAANRMGELLKDPAGVQKGVKQISLLEVDLRLAAQIVDAIVTDPRDR